MVSITGLGREIKTYPDISSVSRSFIVSKADTQAVAASAFKDQVELTVSPDISPEEKTQKLLDTLSKNFPAITFQYASDTDFLNLKKTAASLGHGKHLVLSEAFLNRMKNSEKDFKECKTILMSSVLSLAENHADGVFLGETLATPWKIGEKKDDTKEDSLSQILQNLKQTQEASSTNGKVHLSTNSVSYQTGPLYTKLAQSNSKQLVQTVMSEAYRNLASMRLISCLGESEDRLKAQKAIRSLEKLLVRGRQKIRQLDKETLLRIRKTKAQKQKEEAKAREIQKELKKQLMKRKNRDKIIEKEGQAADWELHQLKQYFSTIDTTGIPVDISSSACGADLAAGGGEVLSCEQISMSEAVAF